MGSSTPPKRVLLITNSEHGQANVFLATSYALLTLPDEDVQVHFASFPSIQKSVLATSNHAIRDNPQARPLVFHEVAGLSMVDAWSRPEVASERQRLAIVDVVSLFYAIRRMMVLLKVMLPWTGPEFVEIMKSVMDIVEDIQADVIAVDPAFSPALTALRYTGTKFMVLSPNTIKDFVMPLQPNGEALWKYPWCVSRPFPRDEANPNRNTSIGAPFPFPVPLHQIPSNILLVILALICAAWFDSHRRSVQAHVAQHLPGAQLTTLNDLSLKHLGLRFLVANLPEIEFPLSAPIPPSITPWYAPPPPSQPPQTNTPFPTAAPSSAPPPPSPSPPPPSPHSSKPPQQSTSTSARTSPSPPPPPSKWPRRCASSLTPPPPPRRRTCKSSGNSRASNPLTPRGCTPCSRRNWSKGE